MTSLPVTCLRRTRPQNFHDPFPRVAYRPHTYIVFVLSQLLLCLSVLAGINQHKGEIVPNRYRWDSYGTLRVKVLYRAPSLITSYRPNARGGLSSYFSQSLELCVATSKYLSTQ